MGRALSTNSVCSWNFRINIINDEGQKKTKNQPLHLFSVCKMYTRNEFS